MRPERRRSRGHARAARLLFFVGGVAGCASAPPGPPGHSEAPDEPVVAFFTLDQATRGQLVFTTVCAVCHGRNEFTGPIFALTWMADPVGHLFQHISTAMPQDRPGSLSAEEYASVVAYFLQLNGRAAGDRELPADAELLGRMRW
jgi:mono/diheme cytochrome c family protein